MSQTSCYFLTLKLASRIILMTPSELDEIQYVGSRSGHYVTRRNFKPIHLLITEFRHNMRNFGELMWNYPYPLCENSVRLLIMLAIGIIHNMHILLH